MPWLENWRKQLLAILGFTSIHMVINEGMFVFFPDIIYEELGYANVDNCSMVSFLKVRMPNLYYSNLVSHSDWLLLLGLPTRIWLPFLLSRLFPLECVAKKNDQKNLWVNYFLNEIHQDSGNYISLRLIVIYIIFAVIKVF